MADITFKCSLQNPNGQGVLRLHKSDDPAATTNNCIVILVVAAAEHLEELMTLSILYRGAFRGIKDIFKKNK